MMSSEGHGHGYLFSIGHAYQWYPVLLVRLDGCTLVEQLNGTQLPIIGPVPQHILYDQARKSGPSCQVVQTLAKRYSIMFS